MMMRGTHVCGHTTLYSEGKGKPLHGFVMYVRRVCNQSLGQKAFCAVAPSLDNKRAISHEQNTSFSGTRPERPLSTAMWVGVTLWHCPTNVREKQSYSVRVEGSFADSVDNEKFREDSTKHTSAELACFTVLAQAQRRKFR